MRTKIFSMSLVLAIIGCSGPSPTPTLIPSPTPTPPQASSRTTAKITNQGPSVSIYAAFGADSAVTAADWSSFCSGSGLNCTLADGKPMVR